MKRLLCAISFMACIGNASAVRVSPFVYDFDPTKDVQSDENKSIGKENEFTYYITNKLDQTIAFEVVVYRRTTDVNGKEKLERDDDSFMLFPGQLIIAPHAERSVKLKWMGNHEFDKNPHKEQAFRVSVKQYRINLNPLKKTKKQSTVEFNFQVNTSLYMTPGQAKSKTIVLSVEKLNNGLARVKVQNKGTRRVNYMMIKNKIDIAGYSGELYKTLGRSDRDGSLQPGEIHEFVVSAPSSEDNVSEKNKNTKINNLKNNVKKQS